MGIIRFLLAFSVVVAHFQYFSSLRLTGGDTAVQAFFIISGFYIALILDGRYSSTKNFLINRFLRLYPTYIIIAAINFYVVMTESGSLPNIFTFPKILSGYLIFTNATMLFQDATMFLGLQDGRVHFVANFLQSNPVLFPYLLIPQAWTLGLEISFYLLAPLLFIKNRKYIYYIFIASIFIRIYLLQHGKFEDPWNYRFFPSEIALFMLGAMAYSIYKTIQFNSNPEFYQKIGAAMLTIIVAYMLFFKNLASNYEFDKGIFYIMLASFMPFIFFVSKNNKLDQFIGNLSYPIYLLWGLRIDVTSKVMLLLGVQGNTIEGIVRYSSIIIMAMMMYFIIEKPMERIRNRFKH